VYELAVHETVTLWPLTEAVGALPEPSVFAFAAPEPDPARRQPAAAPLVNPTATTTATGDKRCMAELPKALRVADRGHVHRNREEGALAGVVRQLLIATAPESVNVEVAPAARSSLRPL